MERTLGVVAVGGGVGGTEMFAEDKGENNGGEGF
jgi:hypothetical protein